MNIAPLLAAVRRRTTHRGVSTAAPFLRELTACLGGACPSQILGNVSPHEWANLLKEADSRLVYHAADMRVAGCDSAALGAERDGKAVAVTLPPHTIATFPAVITTTRQDRDGDVLESLGAELDPATPLLWQHLPTEPIGRLLAEGKRTKSSLTGNFAIAGTALGHDAALLAEHGALRISHGFLPEAYEPLDEDSDAAGFAGFHITAFKILEVSLVSVPSNPDAVITAFSREKLSHPLVKAWAKALFDGRPRLVSGGEVSAEWCPLVPERGHCSQSPPAIADNPNSTHNSPPTTPPMATPDHSPLTTHQLTKTGRVFSAANEKRLQAAAANFKAIAHDDEAHPDVAGLAHKAHECVKSLFAGGGDSGADPDDLEAYTADGESADGAGRRAARARRTEFIPSGLVKAGRAVSAENAAIIEQAIEHGQALRAHEAATPGHKSMAKTAVKKLRDVLATNDDLAADPADDMSYDDGNPAGMQPDAASFDAACQKALAAAVSRYAAGNDLTELRSLARSLAKARKQTKQTIARIKRQQEFDREAAELAEIGL